MRINETNRITMLQSYQKSASKLSDQKNLFKTGKDQLEISPEAQEKLKQTIVDQTHTKSRVNELKDQIASGSYQINSDQIAERLLKHWKNQNGQ